VPVGAPDPSRVEELLPARREGDRLFDEGDLDVIPSARQERTES
jgi:hypothetical protein